MPSTNSGSAAAFSVPLWRSQTAELCPCPSCVLGRSAEERARLCSKAIGKPNRPTEVRSGASISSPSNAGAPTVAKRRSTALPSNAGASAAAQRRSTILAARNNNKVRQRKPPYGHRQHRYGRPVHGRGSKAVDGRCLPLFFQDGFAVDSIEASVHPKNTNMWVNANAGGHRNESELDGQRGFISSGGKYNQVVNVAGKFLCPSACGFTVTEHSAMRVWNSGS